MSSEHKYLVSALDPAGTRTRCAMGAVATLTGSNELASSQKQKSMIETDQWRKRTRNNKIMILAGDTKVRFSDGN